MWNEYGIDKDYAELVNKLYIDNWKFNLCCDGHMTRSYTLMKLQHLTKSTDAHLTQEMFSYFMTMSVIELISLMQTGIRPS